ncbi:MAG: succinate dehydrogenase, cytochrome b556 subunit [Sphingomonas sp.]|jgi:succinate dehydrogenase / fumarate reductase, cytochrome b subunit
MSQSSARPQSRPLSPHLSIWKWGPHMLVSILHRICGVVLATVGTVMFVWWLAALAGGADSYASFHYWVVTETDGNTLGWLANLLAKIVAVGLTWAFFQHLANGIRHFILDIGAGYELKINKVGALATIAFSLTATALTWAYIVTKGISA